ncbi:MAG TPA: glycosyltransferase family 4 protein [Candidatus Diapherotrites archaeon]|uniref:Glycosyltransferase family 4 protein n=1 Tax=Candidatus Iainarchaeum sp. TaxID=3101447 RepID=A0A7J4IXW4_9ARCH|nr:glycosyltransferase family 4 protein [Candidatus Diapherotrites archaeon]
MEFGNQFNGGQKLRPLVLYPYPAELDGVSLQGDFLYKGLCRNGYDAAPCNRKAGFEKEFLYKSFQPNVAIGIGFWGDLPDLVMHPQKHGIQPVPWLNADGWVANYHTTLNSLPLIFTTSKWVKETYIRDGVDNPNIIPQPIGIDTGQMTPLPKTDPRVICMREYLGIKEDEKMILTAGGDTTSKGFQEVLNALGKIGDRFTKWKYIGKAWENHMPYYHYKEEAAIIKQFGFKKKVKYIDGQTSRETLRVLLSAADIYAAPSRIEGFGMLQVEAMACGIPVLSIDAGGIKDTVVHKETGFLAKVGETIDLEQEWAYKEMGFDKKQVVKFEKPKTFAYRADIDDLSQYLLKLLEDGGLCERLGKSGREHAVANFDCTKTSNDMACIIEKRLGLDEKNTGQAIRA